MAQPQPISDEDRLQVKHRMLHGMLTAGGNRTQQELEKTVMELEKGAYTKFADDKAKYWKRLENSVIKYQKLVDKERADLQAAAPAHAAQPPAQAQASAAPGGPGRPPTPSSQPGMWPAPQPAAVAGFPGTAAHQLGSQSMAGHQPSSPAHLRMPQGMAVQQASSQAQQTAYMQQPRSVPMGHQPQMRQQQAQAGGHQGPMQGLLHEGILLPGHQEVSTGDAEFADMAAAFFDSSPQPAQQAQQQPAAAWPPPQQAQQQHQALLYQQQQRHLQQQQQMGMSGGPHLQSQAGVFAQAGQQYPTARSASQQHTGQPLRAPPTQQQHHHLGQAATQYPGQAAGQSVGQYPGQAAGQSAGQYPGQAAGQFAGQQQRPGQYPGQPAGQPAGQQQRPGQYPGLQQQHPGQPAGQAAGQAAATQDTLALFQSTYALFQQNLDLVKAALTEYKVAISRGPSVASAVGENQLNTYGQVLNTAVKSLQGRWNQPTPELSNNPQVITLLKQAQSAFSRPQPQQPGDAPGPSYVETCRSVLAEAIANQGAAAPSSMGPPAQVQQPQQQALPQQQVPSQTAAHQQQQQVPSQAAAHQQQQQVPSQTVAHQQQQQVPSQTTAHQQQQQQQPPQAVQAVPSQPQQTHTLPAPGQAVAGAGLRGQASATTPAFQQQQPAPQPQSVTVELAAQQATGQPLGQAGAQPGAPGLQHGQAEGPTAALTAGQILCNLVGAAPDLALDQAGSGLSRMLWHSGCHVPALPAELTGQAGIQSPTSGGQPGAWLPSSELVPDGVAGHSGVAPRGGPGVSSAGHLQAQGLGLGPGPLVTGPVASPLPSPFGFFTSPALGLTSTVNGMLLGMGLRNMGLHDPLPTPLPGYGQTLPDRAGSAPVAVLGGTGLESKTSSAEGWMMSGGRGLGSSLARNNSLAYSSSLSSNASMASSSTYLGSGMCSAASLPVSLSVPNLVLSKVASQAVMEGREAPESPAGTQSPALASRPLSLLGKRKSATQLVNQERVLQKRQRLAHVEEAVNMLADAMAPVAQLRTADCSAFEDAMLVSCTVGKNAALPEPSSPDSTPQWRTLSLRVSERYPAESPVALFNCPADGLPVPPQAEAARSVFEASVSMLPQPLDLKTMMESWHKAVASVDKAYSSQPAAPAALAGSSGSLAPYGGPLLAGSPAVRGLQ